MVPEVKNPIRRLALLTAACVFVASGPAYSQSSDYRDGASLRAGTLQVPLNKSQIVSADRPIAKAMIGNEQVADILPITDRSIYVLGKKMGTTSLTLYDGAGRVLSVLDVAVGPDVDALATQLHELVPNEKIDARISNDSIVLTGLVNNPGAVDRAVQIAKTYAGDKVVNLMSVGSSQQVMLEVRFAEVSRDADRQLGISGSAISNNGNFSALTGPGSGYAPGNPGTLLASPIAGAFGVIRGNFNLGNVNIEAELNALETRGLSKTLAQPTLVALSGEKASFLAGGEFPVPVAQSGSAGSTLTGANNTAAITVEFKPFGVSLGFTPTVLGDKTINLVVEPEVSEIDSTASLTLNGIVIPGLRTRRASTTLELRDGESFAIAGLLQRDFKTNLSQMPVLGSIPILGALFRSSKFQKGETELLIVVTPHLVAPLKPGQVKLPTDRIKDPREGDLFLMGQPYNPQALPQSGGPGQSAQGVGTEAAPTAPVPGSSPGSGTTQPKEHDGYGY